MPRDQLNERSALTLLALLDLKPDTPWRKASAPMKGVTQMMGYFEAHYGKKYAPNTRETVRRHTLHQFRDAGLVDVNPDDPERPTNSAKTVYQVREPVLRLLQSFGTTAWPKRLREYLAEAGALREKYAQARSMRMLPVQVARGETIALSPGGQNELVRLIVEQFCPRYTPGGRVIYVGDTQRKWAYFQQKELAQLGVKIESHGKMPDVVVHHVEKDWLVLVEAVTSHGPVNAKRRGELKQLFKSSRAGLVYVTAFMRRRDLSKYLSDISWETEVWVAEAPDHLIHFNGERFLGPYEK